jgi:hypothetical protein
VLEIAAAMATALHLFPLASAGQAAASIAKAEKSQGHCFRTAGFSGRPSRLPATAGRSRSYADRDEHIRQSLRRCGFWGKRAGNGSNGWAGSPELQGAEVPCNLQKSFRRANGPDSDEHPRNSGIGKEMPSTVARKSASPNRSESFDRSASRSHHTSETGCSYIVDAAGQRFREGGFSGRMLHGSRLTPVTVADRKRRSNSGRSASWVTCATGNSGKGGAPPPPEDSDESFIVPEDFKFDWEKEEQEDEFAKLDRQREEKRQVGDHPVSIEQACWWEQ